MKNSSGSCLKVLGVIASIATIVATCIAVIALIPAFGQWLRPEIRFQGPNSTLPESVLLRDDFSSRQWETYTDSSSSVEYVDNTLQMIVYTELRWTSSHPNHKNYQNVHVEVNAITNATNSATKFGIICDDKDNQRNTYYYGAVTPAGEYEIGKLVPPGYEVILTNNGQPMTSDAIVTNAPLYRLGMDCGNYILTLYVNGQKIASVSDFSYMSGGVGLFVENGENSETTNISFDDFLIMRLPE